MRSPARIKPTLGLIEILWRKYPDMRLGQLLTNLGCKDLWNLDDEMLMSRTLDVMMHGWDHLFDKTESTPQAEEAS